MIRSRFYKFSYITCSASASYLFSSRHTTHGEVKEVKLVSSNGQNAMQRIYCSCFPYFGLRMNHPWIGHPSFSRNLVNSSDGFSVVASKSSSPSTLNPYASYSLSPISVASIYDGKPNSSAFFIPHSINSRPTPRRRCLGCVKQKLSTVHREDAKLAYTMESKPCSYIYGVRSSAWGGSSGNHGEAGLLPL
jgi:hypothetical protein